MLSEVPDDWRLDALSNLTKQVKRGATPSYSTDATGIFAISQKCIRDGSIDLSAARPHNPAKTVPPKARLLHGDVCVNSTGTGTLGRVAIWENYEGKFFADTHVTVVRPDRDKVEPYMLAAFLGAPSTKETIYQECVTGSTNQIELSAAAFGQLVVPVPPLDEQRRIAEVLRSVDEAIAANRVAVDAARRTLEALATEIVAEAPDTRTVADFGTVVTGGTPSPKNADLWDGDLPFVTPGDLDDECISVRDAARSLNASAPHRARVLPANSVLITCIGSTVGKVAISRRECATNQQINAICCDPALAGYVYLACLAAYDEIVANAGKQAVPIINKSTFSGLSLPCFPRERMLEISEAVDALDDERERSVAALDRLTSTKTSLMTDLLSGRVRVPA